MKGPQGKSGQQDHPGLSGRELVRTAVLLVVFYTLLIGAMLLGGNAYQQAHSGCRARQSPLADRMCIDRIEQQRKLYTEEDLKNTAPTSSN